MHPNLDVLPVPQRRLWPELEGLPGPFVLYGGTAIALHLGHRASVDFDFFSHAQIDPDALLRTVPFLQDCEVLQLQPNTLTVSVDRRGPIKVSLFGDITFGRVGQPERTDDNVIAVASLLDLLATKLKFILQRIEIKDYIDIEAILKSGLALQRGLGAAVTLYGHAFPPMECVKALGYFEEGEARNVPEATRRFLLDTIGRWDGEVERVKRIADTLC
jgi:hypothetical protein